jgi:small subunit ribosomal protein S16
MLIIRLKPIGKTKQISFRVVVGERRSKLNGKVMEDLGFYNPHNDKFGLKEERIKYWISNGAQVSDTVHNILVKGSVIDAPKRKVKMRKSKKGAEAVAEVKTEATPAA